MLVEVFLTNKAQRHRLQNRSSSSSSFCSDSTFSLFLQFSSLFSFVKSTIVFVSFSFSSFL
eukprot:UN15531